MMDEGRSWEDPGGHEIREGGGERGDTGAE